MRDPDKTGAGARAWKMTYTEEMLAAHRAEWGNEPAGISTYIVNSARYHPHWRWWLIGTVHLRHEPGTRPPVLHYPGATHEIGCYTLDPRHPDPDIDRLEQGDLNARGPFLTPPDWVIQFIVKDDDQAAELADLVVDAIVCGNSCDSDYRAFWENAIAKTAEHLRLGGHPDHEEHVA